MDANALDERINELLDEWQLIKQRTPEAVGEEWASHYQAMDITAYTAERERRTKDGKETQQAACKAN